MNELDYCVTSTKIVDVFTSIGNELSIMISMNDMTIMVALSVWNDSKNLETLRRSYEFVIRIWLILSILLRLSFYYLFEYISLSVSHIFKTSILFHFAEFSWNEKAINNFTRKEKQIHVTLYMKFFFNIFISLLFSNKI